MNTSKQSDEMVAKLAALPGVERVSYVPNRFLVKYPRSRGGTVSLTWTDAKAAVEKGH